MSVLKIQSTSLICQSVTGLSSNANLNYVGSDASYNEDARVKGSGSFLGDDEWLSFQSRFLNEEDEEDCFFINYGLDVRRCQGPRERRKARVVS